MNLWDNTSATDAVQMLSTRASMNSLAGGTGDPNEPIWEAMAMLAERVDKMAMNSPGLTEPQAADANKIATQTVNDGLRGL